MEIAHKNASLDPDRLGDAREPVVVVETIGERIEAVGAGAMRRVILHKLMEELLRSCLHARATSQAGLLRC